MTSMRVISSNLLIDYDDTRIRQQCLNLVNLDPDVILLQEVYYKNIVEMSAILSGYQMFDIFYTALMDTKMGCMIFVRKSIVVEAVEYKLFDKTFMERGYYAVRIDNIWYLTTHLESMDKPQFDIIRRRQLNEIWTFLGSDNFVIGMDSNIRGAIPAPSGAVDLWESDPCPTWHADRFFNYTAEARFDRLIVKGASISYRTVIEDLLSDHDILLADHQ